MLGYYAPGSYEEFQELSSIKSATKAGPADSKMLNELENDHMTIVSTIKEVIKVAEKGDDSTTADVLSGRRNFHEQTAWMLRSLQK